MTLTILDATPGPTTFDARQWADTKIVGCRHPKRICHGCAIALAAGAHADGQATERGRTLARLRVQYQAEPAHRAALVALAAALR